MRPEEMNWDELWAHAQTLERELADANAACAAYRAAQIVADQALTRSEARCKEMGKALRLHAKCPECSGTGKKLVQRLDSAGASHPYRGAEDCEWCKGSGLVASARAALATEGDDRGYPSTGRPPESAL